MAHTTNSSGLPIMNLLAKVVSGVAILASVAIFFFIIKIAIGMFQG